MYVHVYIYVHSYAYKYLYSYMYIYVYEIHIYIYIYIHTYVYLYMYVIICILMYVCMHSRVYINLYQLHVLQVPFPLVAQKIYTGNMGTANTTWGDIFESSFNAQSSKLERLFSLKSGKRDVRTLSFEL